MLGNYRSQVTSKISKIGRFKGNDIIEQCISYEFCLRRPSSVDVPAIKARFLSDRLQGHPFVSGGDENGTSGFQYRPPVCCARWAARSAPLGEISFGFASHKPKVSCTRTILSLNETYGYTALLNSY